MSDTASIATAQRAYWNSEATHRWVTEQAQIDRLFAGVTEAALAAAAPKPGEHVLDIGCGTGTTLLRLAAAVGPSGRALGVDISEQQLTLARRRIAEAGTAQASVVLHDAATYQFPAAGFDLAFTRFGVMFFADPVAAFTNIRRALKPGGRLALAVFRPGTDNPGPPRASPRSTIWFRRPSRRVPRNPASSVGAIPPASIAFWAARAFEMWC